MSYTIPSNKIDNVQPQTLAMATEDCLKAELLNIFSSFKSEIKRSKQEYNSNQERHFIFIREDSVPESPKKARSEPTIKPPRFKFRNSAYMTRIKKEKRWGLNLSSLSSDSSTKSLSSPTFDYSGNYSNTVTDCKEKVSFVVQSNTGKPSKSIEPLCNSPTICLPVLENNTHSIDSYRQTLDSELITIFMETLNKKSPEVDANGTYSGSTYNWVSQELFNRLCFEKSTSSSVFLMNSMLAAAAISLKFNPLHSDAIYYYSQAVYSLGLVSTCSPANSFSQEGSPKMNLFNDPTINTTNSSEQLLSNKMDEFLTIGLSILRYIQNYSQNYIRIIDSPHNPQIM